VKDHVPRKKLNTEVKPNTTIGGSPNICIETIKWIFNGAAGSSPYTQKSFRFQTKIGKRIYCIRGITLDSTSLTESLSGIISLC